jgi:hypothetical protein
VRSVDDEATTLSAIVLSMLTVRAWPDTLCLLHNATLLLLPTRGMLQVLQGLQPVIVLAVLLLLLPPNARLLMLP